METIHPREIELGLARTGAVGERMGLAHLPFPIVTVAGTNGKGSTVALLEHCLHAAGYRVGAYTSPHLLAYNERVRLTTEPVGDAALCEAFEAVEQARGATSLSYFEFGTLAALELLRRARVDIAILEVGLGGRLDAVNLWDADIAMISAIGIDHTDWLGDTRESIGREKAGIFRAGRPAICSDPNPPDSIAAAAARVGAQLLLVHRDFDFAANDQGWNWRSRAQQRAGLPYPAMRGTYQLYNASGVLMALELLAARFPVTQTQVRAGLLGASLPGRFQTLPGRPLRVLDVAHNPQAAQALAATLRDQPVSGKTIVVVGMLKDKPIVDVMRAMAVVVDRWHVASLGGARGATAEQLSAAMAEAGIRAPITLHADVSAAYAAACREARTDDRVVAFGSFHTVGAILRAQMDSA
ncbi:MAG: bifunctional tetrahydrofolate synthase/dihydrofolate synthase [Gammaproteobacteria bacterium]|nr:bifunctional tetrahydrofolate synthase/dihydrofolate synthase [Gammaproteobacteria bacterium]